VVRSRNSNALVRWGLYLYSRTITSSLVSIESAVAGVDTEHLIGKTLASANPYGRTAARQKGMCVKLKGFECSRAATWHAFQYQFDVFVVAGEKESAVARAWPRVYMSS